MLKKTLSTGKTVLLLFFIISVSHARVCQCDTVTNEFTFTNNKDSVQHYSIIKSGPAASWTTLTPMSFALAPGESQLVVAFTRIGCSVPEGVASLTLKAASENDLITKSYDFSVSTCHGIALSHLSSYDACINHELVIPVNVTNDGDYPENVTLSSNAWLSSDALFLASGESTSIDLFITPTVVGTSLIDISVFFSGRSESSINLNVTECRQYTASLSKSYVSLCEQETEELSLTVINHGPRTDFFFTSDSVLVSVPSQLTIDDSAVIPVSVFSGCDSGLSRVLISVWADGARLTSLPLVVNLKDCMRPIIVSSFGSGLACACELINQSFTLFNPSGKSMIYAVVPNAGGLNVSSVTLGADESVNLFLSYPIPCGYSGALTLFVNATSVNDCSKSQSAFVNFNVSPWRECELVSVDGLGVVPVDGLELSVPVTVRNIGYRPTSYSLLVTGSAVSNLLGLSKAFLTLEPGQSEVVELMFDTDGLTGGFVSVKAFSTDNLASDDLMISFGGGLSDFELYFFLIPSAVIALVIVYFFRGKFFNRSGPSSKS